MSTAISTLNGRRYRPQSRVTRRTGQRRSLFAAVAQRIARRRFEAARRAHARQDRTDAYLDNAGFAGVDLGALLTGYAGR